MSSKEYFDKLEEYVYDVQRAVTPRWLSRELGINLAAARRLIEDFYASEKLKKRSKSIAAVYVVSGVPKASHNDSDNSTVEVNLVPDCKLAEAEKQFDSVSKSIYCLYPSDLTVSPSSLIVNANCEHAVESKDDFGKYERILSKACAEPRSEQKIEELRRNAFKSGESLGFTKHVAATASSSSGQHQPKKANTIASAFAKKTTSKPLARSESEPSVKREKSDDKVEQEPAAAAPSSAKENEKKNKPEAAKTKPGSKPGALTAMFSRQAEKNKTAPPKTKKETLSSEETPEPRSQSQKRTLSKEPEEPEVDKEPSPKRKSPPAKKAKTTRESKRKPAAKKQTKKEAPKRKRVTALFSDSSESESDEEKRDKVLRGEAMEVEEPEPEPEAQAPDFASSDEDEVVQATPKEKQTISRGKHKVKRWVEKTFLDDDGFMVTEKVMEEVEEEDAEPEPEAAPVVPNKPAEQKNKLELEPDKENKKGVEDGGKGRGRPKKVASVSSGKQSSIMNFFTKAK